MTNDVSKVKKSLREINPGREVEVHERVSLRSWTSLHVGGVGDLVLRCHTVDAVQAMVDLLASHGCRWCVWGTGSSIVPSDRGLRVPILALGGALGRWEVSEGQVVAGGGANMTQLGRVVAHTLDPKRDGSAAQSLASMLIEDGDPRHNRMPGGASWIEIVRPGSTVTRIESCSQHQEWSINSFSRRVIVRAAFTSTRRGRQESSIDRVRLMTRSWRRVEGAVHGVFRRHASEDVEEVLRTSLPRSMSVGGAEITKDFPNSIITTRRCSSEDIRQLCAMMRMSVREAAGIELESRLRFLDQDGRMIPG